MLKKGFVILLITLSCLITDPFSVSAEGTEIDGFDYTNYYEADYIESDGNVYVNMGRYPTRYSKFEFKAYMDNVQAGWLFGATNGTSSDNYGMSNIISGDNYVCYAGYNKSYTPRFTTVFTGTISRAAGFNISDGVTTYSYSYNGSNTATNNTRNVYLFGRNNSGTAGSFSKSKIYYFFWYSNSETKYLHKLYPAVRKSDNAVGFYDTVTQSFYGKSGSGSLTYGSLVNQNYTVSTSVYPSNGGSVTGAGSYLGGSTAVLVATANQGYTFDSWSNGSTSNPLNLIVTGNVSITANFIPVLIEEDYTITTSVDPAGSGSVTGGGTYRSGTDVTLTANPASGYVFDHWSNGSTSNPLVFTASDDDSFTAYFVPEQSVTTYQISASVDPANSGSVTGTGSFQENTTVTLTASAASGYVFDGWYLDGLRVASSSSYSILVDDDYDLVAKFSLELIPPSSGWTDWTDEEDSLSLEDITESFGSENISLNIVKRLVVDRVFSNPISMSFNGQNVQNISFVGSYYDNTVNGIQMCNSSSYSQQNISQDPVENVTIHPFVVGSLNAGQYGSIQFGIEVVDENLGQTTTNVSTIQNTTEACRLVGYLDDDTSLNYDMWTSIGYQAVTATDQNNGYTATLYVPGNEQMSFSSENLSSIISAITATLTNRFYYDYHYEYDVYVSGRPGFLLPDYGSISTKLSLFQLLYYYNFGSYLNNEYDSISFKSDSFTILPGSQQVYTTGRFNSRLTNNIYQSNETTLYWTGTNYPQWHFRDQERRGTTTSPYDFINQFSGYDFEDGANNWFRATNITRGSFDDDLQYYTLTSEDASALGLTAGAELIVYGADITLYRLKDNSLLNRFNQLGSFLNNWFSRIYNSIANITGGSESNDVTNNIVNDYDINIDTDITNIITDVQDQDQNIDLTSPDLTVDPSHLNGMQQLTPVASETVKVFTTNGIGILLFLPLIIAILGRIL